MIENGYFFLLNSAERKLKPDREDKGGWLSDMSVCVYLKQGSLGILFSPPSPVTDQTRIKLEIN